MSSLLSELNGVQAPRVRLVPRAAANDVDDAVFLGRKYGLPPDEWQENVLEGWLGTRTDGTWAAPRCGLAVPRQNGKNGVLELRELFGLVVLGERFLHTAHEVKTARKAFVRLLEFFDNPRQFPELAGMVKEVRRTNGQEAVVLHNGGSVEFVARSKGSGRGFSVDALVMDEAQELSEDSLAALLPTISASPNPQQIMTGTPPGPTANGEVFTRVRRSGVAGHERRLCWMEWSVDEHDKSVDLDNRKLWAQANPALGLRLRHETTSDERGAFDDETFGRERLGMWMSDVDTAAALPWEAWAAGADKLGLADGTPVSFAVDVRHDRSSSSIAVAGKRPDGSWNVEIVDDRPGTSWVVPRLLELQQRHTPLATALDAGGPAGSLLPALAEAGVVVTQVSTREFAQACGAFHDDVLAGQVHHASQPVLDAAVRTSRTRPMGEAWCWSRKTGVPLIAATLARHVHGKALAAPVDSRMFVF